MTSTLLRPPTRELSLLQWTGQMKKVKFNEYSALRFASNALGALRNAKTPALSPHGRFSMAYEGTYALCLGSIYLHGLLPTGKTGHQEMVVQVACEMIGLALKDRDTLMAVSRHYQAITSEGGEPLELQNVRDLVDLGYRALSQAHYSYPDWFL